MSDLLLDDQSEHGSVLLGHCTKVYEAMYEQAQNTPQGLVYSGHLTRLFTEIGLGQPYYTAVTRKLKSMDCIRMIRRGGGAKPSQWMLLQAPSEELFQLPDTYRGRVSTSGGAKGMFEQQLKDLNNRMLKLEAWASTQGYR